jgi:hypothetical protein
VGVVARAEVVKEDDSLTHDRDNHRYHQWFQVSHFRNHLNCGTVGTLICGGGSGATFLAFASPLGSVTWLCTVPITPTFGRKAEPPPRANEAVVEAKTTRSTEAIFTAVFDMGKLH